MQSCSRDANPVILYLTVPEAEQDTFIKPLLRRLWKKPPPQTFRPLSALIAYWSDETRNAMKQWWDPALVNDGLEMLAALAGNGRDAGSDAVLLTTDLH